MRVHLLEFNVVLQEDLDLFAEVEFLLEQEDAQEGVVQAVGRDLVAHVAVADERVAAAKVAAAKILAGQNTHPLLSKM